MSDLIDREKFIYTLIFSEKTKSIFVKDLRSVIEVANEMPSAEPERKKGEWIEYPDCLRYEGAYNDDHIVCSECGHVFSICDNCTEEFDFCPHCGADMRGE